MRSLTLSLVLGLVPAISAQVNVLTANYSLDRTNANLRESTLTPANVGPATFGKIGVLPVDGQVYAQPLIAGTVAYVASMHNSVYAYDISEPEHPVLVWTVNLGLPVPSTFLQFADISPETGILSTPVIDLDRNVIFVVADTFVDGEAVFRLHALDLATGEERLNGPVAIAGSVNGNGAGSSDGKLAFDAHWHLQRPGLTLSNSTVYIAFGSHSDAGPYHGWLFGYDASDLGNRQVIIATTPNSTQGAIWQAGRAPAVDDKGNIYLITGNGNYDGNSEFGESFVKISAGAPELLDWFTPGDWQSLSDADDDLAAGPALVPGAHLLIGGNKLGQLYLVNGDSMGQLDPSAQTLSATGGGIFNFAIWPRQDDAVVYLREQFGPLHAFRIAGGQFEPQEWSTSTATADSAYSGLAISGDGTDETAIVWETTSVRSGTARLGTLHAFLAADLTIELWNTGMQPERDELGEFAKFANPTVANGCVYVPTFSNEVAIYGLLTNLDRRIYVTPIGTPR